MKYLYVFQQLGGELTLENGKYKCAENILHEIDSVATDKIAKYWNNSKANNDIPFFELGEIKEIRVLPRYIKYTRRDGNLGIKRLTRLQPTLNEHPIFGTSILYEEAGQQYKEILDESWEQGNDILVEMRIEELKLGLNLPSSRNYTE